VGETPWPQYLFAEIVGRRYDAITFGETGHAGGQSNAERKITIMGDKSPKSLNKHTTQKQTKAESAVQRKKQAIAAKQAPAKKK